MELLIGRESICGRVIGGRGMIREMLDFAARGNVRSKSELMPMKDVNAAFERVRRNQARYRTVLVN